MVIDEVLKNEIYKSLGCTEVALIGYTVAKAKPKDLKEIKEIKLILGKSVFKNAFSVGVPNTGKFGILPAVVGGLLGEKENGLEIFRDIEYDEELENIVRNRLKIEVVNKDVYCRVIINKIYEAESTYYYKRVDDKLKEKFKSLDLKDFLDYIDNLPKDIEELIKDVIKTNKEFVNGFLDIDFGDLNNIIKATASAVYNRMMGFNKEAYAIAGSGNMGLMATLPIIFYDRENRELIKSLALSALITIYATYHTSYISSMCGCVNRGGLGCVCGLAYYLNKDIEKAMKSFLANITGIICDGGKPSCSLKIASGVFSAYLSLFYETKDYEGIIGKDFKECIKNLSEITKSMNLEDKIIELMLKKDVKL
ncbi:hypothetical protein J422_04915 [Methanocaldococcus villosus KIN24-T80]|uniref:L-cysteine desulfidase n=1 Tax=Methanocaldococcus villosus KIN24-T80 TaxID=1069083 RepID=N6VPY2_9EURY|nr:L-serine ammonia-lyase, iron-sulfur-dependent, subunit alpha [Methanocaldococcus villosus]ENN95955.1 hypothetical protein J422_04915 [Methanocaldococcus villosus KIN24-T80]